MVNLRHFFFIPKTYTPIPSSNLLDGCSFQLRTFVWKFVDAKPSHIANFLRTQNRLLHCEVIYTQSTETLVWLPTNACVNLISATIYCQWLPYFIHRESIMALELDLGSGQYLSTEVNHTVLRRLKYLSVKTWMLDTGFPGTILSNIILLDICYWRGSVSHLHVVSFRPKILLIQTIQTMKHLSSFPQLKTLILRLSANDSDQDIEKQVILPTFQQFPLLERVISHLQDDIPYYTTFIVLRPADDTQMEVKVQVTDYEHDISRPWWARYDV